MAITSTFVADKPDGTFRVFVLGGSQAQGCPFASDGMSIEGDDYLGTATWLKHYLQELLPKSDVEVINAALAGQNLAMLVPLFDEILAHGQPDLVIFLSGNNESTRVNPSLSQQNVTRIMSSLAENFGVLLRGLVKAAQSAAVPTYFLTVPSNLRDWEPAGPVDEQHSTLRALLAEGKARQVLDLLGSPSEPSSGDPSNDPIRQYLKGQAYDQLGLHDEAWSAYLHAKDRDAVFRRARTAWNSLILTEAQGEFAHAINTEERIRLYASDGIPGFDLFVDNCHLNVRGQRIIALEVARAFAAGRRGPKPLWLSTLPSPTLLKTEETFDDRRHLDSALRVLETSITADPKSRVNPMVLGMLYAELGRTEEARALFRRAAATRGISTQPLFDELIEREVQALAR